MSSLIHVANQLEKYTEGEQLIVVQSTSYPGTTEEIFLPALLKSKQKNNLNFYLSFSPERVDPGNNVYNIRNTPKVVGGINLESTDLTKKLFEQVVGNVVPTSSTMTAEMTKLLENSFRLINISFINEFSKLCEKMNIEPIEVINAASTKPFGFMPFYPSIGIGGHCIPVDPYYLSWKAKEFDFITRFIDLANEINEKRPYETVEEIRNVLESKSNKTLNKSKVLVVGVSFKPNVKDTRNSASIKVIRLLNKLGAEIEFYDPYVKEVELGENNNSLVLKSKKNLTSDIDKFDIVLLLTRHSEIDYEPVKNLAKLFFEPFKINSYNNRV